MFVWVLFWFCAHLPHIEFKFSLAKVRYPADTDVFDYFSLVPTWDTSGCTVEMHLQKQQKSN